MARRVIIILLIFGGVSFYLIFSGMKESISFYITPKEFFENYQKYSGKRLRLGGFVSNLQINNLEHFFTITDGEYSIPVTFRGIPPDLFGRAKGAIVEGFWDAERKIFVAKLIMAKHSEEYHPPNIEK